MISSKTAAKILSCAFLILAAMPAAAQPDHEALAPYPSPQKMYAEIQDLARDFPGRVRVIEYGKSVEGRPLLVVFIHRPGEKAKPAAWIGGNIHGNEWIGNRMAMAIARLLLDGDGKDPRITAAMDAMDFFIAPCINPDGYHKTRENYFSDDWALCRKNAHQVDLNRNFPMPGKPLVPIDWAGSPDPGSVHYRGPAPLSEPETRAIDEFMKQHPEIIAAISWHSYAAVMYPAHCPSHACMVRFKKMCRAYRDNQPLLKYPRLQNRVFDSYTGEMEDWLYAEYGILATDIEIGKGKMNKKACECDDLFWTFNPKNPEWWIENDARAAIAAMLEAEHITGGARIPPESR